MTNKNSKYKYYCTGDCEHRRSEDYFRYNFIAAGHCRRSKTGKMHFFSKELCRLKKDDKFFAYKKHIGYIGYGIILEEAIPIDKFVVDGYPDKKLYELPEIYQNLGGDHEKPECEWVAKVKWIKIFSDKDAKKFTRIFSSRNVVCNLYDKHKETIDFLEKEFGIK